MDISKVGDDLIIRLTKEELSILENAIFRYQQSYAQGMIRQMHADIAEFMNDNSIPYGLEKK